MPDTNRPITLADLDRVVETIAHEISRRAEETAVQLKFVNQSLELISASLQGMDQRTAVLTRILT